MSETERSERRVLIDMPSEALPKLMELLGGFVVDHNLTITVIGADKEPGRAPETTLQYNPDLVTEVSNGSGEKVAVVTATSLREFARAKCDGDTSLGSRLASGLLRSRNLQNYPKLVPYVLMADEPGSDTQLPPVLGIRADRMQDLATLFQSHELYGDQIGEKSIEFLALCSSELFVTQTDAGS